MRNTRTRGLTVESLVHDCLDVRELRRRRILGDDWLRLGPTLRWPRITRLQAARYLIILFLRDRSDPQQIRVSWTRLRLGGDRPWLHCPHCQKRVAKLYCGLGGYVCRACLGTPLYASQRLSAQARPHYQACKLRLRLGGSARPTEAFPERPQGMHRRTYQRLRRRGLALEAGLSKRIRSRAPDYANLVAYID